MEISAGQRRNTVKGVVGGALIGAGIGAITGYLAGDDPCKGGQQPVLNCKPTTTRGEKMRDLVQMGVIAGTAVGAIAGTITRNDQWVIMSRSTTSMTPVIDGRGRLGLAIRL